MTNETYKDNLELINDHREALGLSTFDTLTIAQMTEHLNRIDKNAPFGNSPWPDEETDKKEDLEIIHILIKKENK